MARRHRKRARRVKLRWKHQKRAVFTKPGTSAVLRRTKTSKADPFFPPRGHTSCPLGPLPGPKYVLLAPPKFPRHKTNGTVTFFRAIPHKAVCKGPKANSPTRMAQRIPFIQPALHVTYIVRLRVLALGHKRDIGQPGGS